MSSSIILVVGLIAIIFVFTIIVTAYPAVMGSVANDAATNNVSNSTTVRIGNAIAVGFMGFTQAEVALIIILLIVAVILLMFVL